MPARLEFKAGIALRSPSYFEDSQRFKSGRAQTNPAATALGSEAPRRRPPAVNTALAYAVGAIGVVAAALAAPLRLRLDPLPDRGALLTVRLAGVPVMRKAVRPAARTGSSQIRPAAAAAFLASERGRPLARALAGAPGRRWLTRTHRAIDLHEHQAKLIVGLADPAATSQLFALLTATSVVPRIPIAPDFSGPRFEPTGTFECRSHLGRLLWPTLGLLIEPGVAPALWRAVRPKRSRD